MWRYISYSKFLDLLRSSSLYFCRLDVFVDKLEATQPDGSKEFVKLTGNPWQAFERWELDRQLDIIRNRTFANCWHINSDENPDMWENYVLYHGNEGVAIQTTFEHLTNSINTDRIITDIKMQYIDYSTHYMDYFMANCFDFLTIKDKKYEYEREMRLITVEDTYPIFNSDDDIDSIEFYKHKGEKIPVDLNKLIHKIYISPNASVRFKNEIIEQIKKIGLDVTVEISKINL